MQKSGCAACEFLHAARGNWRNAIFIECTDCPYESHNPCVGHLLIPDADGTPIIIPADALGMTADKEECSVVLNRREFEAIYYLWIEWQVDSPGSCPLRTLVSKCDCN